MLHRLEPAETGSPKHEAEATTAGVTHIKSCIRKKGANLRPGHRLKHDLRLWPGNQRKERERNSSTEFDRAIMISIMIRKDGVKVKCIDKRCTDTGIGGRERSFTVVLICRCTAGPASNSCHALICLGCLTFLLFHPHPVREDRGCKQGRKPAQVIVIN